MNPYQVLSVTPNSTQQDIKSAYRREASKSHPDHGGSHERMRDVNIAYDLLSKYTQSSKPFVPTPTGKVWDPIYKMWIDYSAINDHGKVKKRG